MTNDMKLPRPENMRSMPQVTLSIRNIVWDAQHQNLPAEASEKFTRESFERACGFMMMLPVRAVQNFEMTYGVKPMSFTIFINDERYDIDTSKDISNIPGLSEIITGITMQMGGTLSSN